MSLRRFINPKLMPNRPKSVPEKDRIKMWRIVRGDEVKKNNGISRGLSNDLTDTGANLLSRDEGQSEDRGGEGRRRGRKRRGGSSSVFFSGSCTDLTIPRIRI